MERLSRPQLSDKSTKAGIAIRVADCVAPLYWSRRLFHAAVRSEDCFYIRSRCGLERRSMPDAQTIDQELHPYGVL
jgi:hypothetical protein